MSMNDIYYLIFLKATRNHVFFHFYVLFQIEEI